MRAVKLFTRDGGFVVAGRVPPFVPGHEADILIWGTRVFALDHYRSGAPRVMSDDALVYNEVFAVALVDVDLPEPA